MPFLQQHPDSLWGDVRSLPNPQLCPDLPEQIQRGVAVLPVLQLDSVVFSSHSHTGEPGTSDTSMVVNVSKMRNKQPTPRRTKLSNHLYNQMCMTLRSIQQKDSLCCTFTFTLKQCRDCIQIVALDLLLGHLA